MLTETDIARIARRVAAAYRPAAVGIFGSYAIGTATGRSDLDLFVIRKPGAAFPADKFTVRRLLFDVLHPIDVQVFDPAEFEESAYEGQSFIWVIARQARLYHWDAEAERVVPSLVTRAAASLP
jgi:predicted nucleotidyltransferase